MFAYYPIMWILTHYLTNVIFSTILNHSSIFGYSDYFHFFIMISNVVANIYIAYIFEINYLPSVYSQMFNWCVKRFSHF